MEKSRMTIATRNSSFSRSISDNSFSPKTVLKDPRRALDGLALDQLPNELLQHIFEFLDSRPPSVRFWHHRPSRLLTHSPDHPLKNLSCTSKLFRRLLFSLLFRHVRLDPSQHTSVLSFLTHESLCTSVHTLVATLAVPYAQLHPPWWSRLLAILPLQTFTIICPPYVLAELTGTPVVNIDGWAFNMPYQSIRFTAPPSTNSLGNRPNNYAFPKLLNALPWSGFATNEGSSLKAYSQYEYFLRCTPSFLSAIALTLSPAWSDLIPHLQHFSYTAIFPFYNHVDKVLKSVRWMTSLVTLTTKLCPEPGSSVIEDEIRENGGHININDSWMEFETAYALVGYVVVALGREARLEEWRVEDVRYEGVREHLEASVSERLGEGWMYGSEGVWRKRKAVEDGARDGEKPV